MGRGSCHSPQVHPRRGFKEGARVFIVGNSSIVARGWKVSAGLCKWATEGRFSCPSLLLPTASLCPDPTLLTDNVVIASGGGGGRRGGGLAELVSCPLRHTAHCAHTWSLEAPGFPFEGRDCLGSSSLCTVQDPPSVLFSVHQPTRRCCRQRLLIFFLVTIISLSSFQEVRRG